MLGEWPWTLHHTERLIRGKQIAARNVNRIVILIQSKQIGKAVKCMRNSMDHWRPQQRELYNPIDRPLSPSLSVCLSVYVCVGSMLKFRNNLFIYLKVNYQKVLFFARFSFLLSFAFVIRCQIYCDCFFLFSLFVYCLFSLFFFCCEFAVKSKQKLPLRFPVGWTHLASSCPFQLWLFFFSSF